MYTDLQRAMAALAFDAYRPSPQNVINIPGWTVIDPGSSQRHRHDGFDATVYRSNSGQIVIAFRGTDLTPDLVPPGLRVCG
jgi:hypothetical protein